MYSTYATPRTVLAGGCNIDGCVGSRSLHLGIFLVSVVAHWLAHWLNINSPLVRMVAAHDLSVVAAHVLDIVVICAM